MEEIKLFSIYMCISDNLNLSSPESFAKMMDQKKKKPVDETMYHKLLK